MSVGALWLVAGLVLAGLEMVAPGVFLLWVGLAALGTGGLTLLAGLGWHAQLGVFVALAIGLVGLVGLRLRRPGVDAVNAPGANVVGQLCRCISFEQGEGRVSLGDGQWPARLAAGDTALPGQPLPGEALRVVGLAGTVLLVEPA